MRDSDAALILTRSDAESPGTAVAVAAAQTYAKPYLIVAIDAPDCVERVRAWFEERPGIRILSIGGPRESEAPGIYASVLSILTGLVPGGVQTARL